MTSNLHRHFPGRKWETFAPVNNHCQEFRELRLLKARPVIKADGPLATFDGVLSGSTGTRPKAADSYQVQAHNANCAKYRKGPLCVSYIWSHHESLLFWAASLNEDSVPYWGSSTCQSEWTPPSLPSGIHPCRSVQSPPSATRSFQSFGRCPLRCPWQHCISYHFQNTTLDGSNSLLANTGAHLEPAWRKSPLT